MTRLDESQRGQRQDCPEYVSALKVLARETAARYGVLVVHTYA